MKSILLLPGIFLMGTILLHAQDVGPDSLFGGGDGLVYHSIFDNLVSEADGIALQADHKILISGSTLAPDGNGHAFLARYNEDGSIDNSFNGNGRIVLDLQENSYSSTIKVQPDGKIVLCAESNDTTGEKIWVLRFSEDGIPDNSFDGDGKVYTSLGSQHISAESFVLQPDGKIVLGGYAGGDLADSFYVIRFLPNGAFDHSFDGDGFVKTGVGENYTNVGTILLQPDGKIILAGYGSFNGFDDFALVRYNSNGSLDNSFSGDGITHLMVSEGDDRIKAGVLQPDGKIVVAGFALNPITNQNSFAIARLNPDGTPDNSFHGNGMALTYITDLSDGAHALLRQPDGKFVMAGYVHSNKPGYGFALSFARVNPNGVLDNSFDGDGVFVLENEAGTESLIDGMALQPDGKIVGTGIFRTNPLNQVMLFRITTGLTTSTREVDQSINGVSIYPNPASDHIILNYTNDQKEKINITLCDGMGRTISKLLVKAERNAGNHEEHLKLNGSVLPGNYFLKMETGSGMKTMLLIKE